METLSESAPSLFLVGGDTAASVRPEGPDLLDLGHKQRSGQDFFPETRVHSSEPRALIGMDADRPIPVRKVSYERAKRAFDVVTALAILAFAWPFMLAAAILIKLADRGPILFKQIRVGEGGRHFWCYKFRSMCVDAEQKKFLLKDLNEVSGPVFKIKHDPRVTRVGAVLRKFSIDELPQLFNVLRGDMSIVGPRPPVPSEVAMYDSRALGRLAVRPGLTCLWQVNGRSSIGFDRWVELDLLYIENMSFWNDCRIVLKTVPAVLTGDGAH